MESFKALFLILSIVSDMGEFHEQITKASGMSHERVIKEIVSREHTQKCQTIVNSLTLARVFQVNVIQEKYSRAQSRKMSPATTVVYCSKLCQRQFRMKDN